MNTIKKIYDLTENEQFSISCDFINSNREITNDKVPISLLHLWHDERDEPTGLSLRVFKYILDLNFNSKEDISIYKAQRYFYAFQIILATSVYHLDNHLSLHLVQIFKLENYHLPKMDTFEILYKEYIKYINPTLFEAKVKGHKKIRAYDSKEICIAPKFDNLVLVNELLSVTFSGLSNEQINDSKICLFKRICSGTLAMVKYGILFVGKDESKCIKISFNSLRGYITATMKVSESTPIEPINNKDKKIKKQCLVEMHNADKISFEDNGANVKLSFHF